MEFLDIAIDVFTQTHMMPDSISTTISQLENQLLYRTQATEISDRNIRENVDSPNMCLWEWWIFPKLETVFVKCRQIAMIWLLFTGFQQISTDD